MLVVPQVVSRALGDQWGAVPLGCSFFIIVAVYSAIIWSPRPEDGDEQKPEGLGARLSFDVSQHRS